MSRDFDDFPTYDPLGSPIMNQVFLSNIWRDAFSSFIESLQEYLSQNGVFIPRLTLAQRNLIKTPGEGQMIYVMDANTPASPRTAELQIWQVVAGVAGWTVIV